jgi:hypothetical protein
MKIIYGLTRSGNNFLSLCLSKFFGEQVGHSHTKSYINILINKNNNLVFAIIRDPSDLILSEIYMQYTSNDNYIQDEKIKGLIKNHSKIIERYFDFILKYKDYVHICGFDSFTKDLSLFLFNLQKYIDGDMPDIIWANNPMSNIDIYQIKDRLPREYDMEVRNKIKELIKENSNYLNFAYEKYYKLKDLESKQS